MAETTPSQHRPQQQPPVFAHRHVKAFLSLPSWTPPPPPLEEEEEEEENTSKSSSSTRNGDDSIQVIRDGSLLTADNLCSNTHHQQQQTTKTKSQQQQQQQQQQLSLHQPMLILDTPESIGMKLPVVPKNKKKKKKKRKANDKEESHQQQQQQSHFSIRHVADLLGADFSVRVINVAEQEELSGWTLGDLVDYFHDEERLLRNAANARRNNRDDHDSSHHNNSVNDATTTSPSPSPSPAPAPARRQRSTRKAARQSYVNRQHHEEASTSAYGDDDDDDAPMVLNQISLEFSNTKLGKQVQSPQFVRDLDWIDHAWRRRKQRIVTNNKKPPAATNKSSSSSSSSNSSHATHKGKQVQQDKDELPYPAVQYYCLTSAAGCYTDFHIDFGGSSVWYHVLTGAKEFCLIPPTRENLQAYEEWLCSPHQAETFLARTILDAGRTVYRVVLQQGQTMIIPAGWIHAVYTPLDSLVFGGNFLHGFDIETQLDVYSIEIRSRVLEEYRFPMFIQLHFAAASMYLHKLQQVVQEQQHGDGASSSNSLQTRLLSDCELQSLGRLIEAVTMWWNPKMEETNAESMPAVARRIAAEHDCATFDDFLTLFREEHARVLAVSGTQSRYVANTCSGQEVASTTTADNGKEEKPVISSTALPRLRLKLSSSSKVTAGKKVSESTTTAAEKPSPLDKSKHESPCATVDKDNTGENDTFRIVVSATSRQGTTGADRNAQKGDDEWLPSEGKKQPTSSKKRLAVVRGGGAAGALSPRKQQQQQQQPAKKRTKKAEIKTTATQRLSNKMR